MFIDKRLKLIVIFVVVLGAATLLVFTFGEKKRGNEAVSTLVENESYLKGSLKASTETAVVVDNVQVYLDEVTYYAMTTQATYETYYIANNMTLDWNSKVEDGVTLEMAVKSKELQNQGIDGENKVTATGSDGNKCQTDGHQQETAHKDVAAHLEIAPRSLEAPHAPPIYHAVKTRELALHRQSGKQQSQPLASQRTHSDTHKTHF